MSKVIAFVPLADGSVKLEPRGYEGPGCLEATADLEVALGRVLKRAEKPELYNRVTKSTHVEE